MTRLVTLGTTDLRAADGRALESVVRQPRRFALLVFLALESRRGTVRRDRILSVFWPEVTSEQGRRSLSQALHYLRRALGPDAVTARGAEELQLDRARVHCDACSFLDAIEARDPEAALRLYGGELLPAFFGGVPDFDDWLDRTRQALRRAAAEAAWDAAARARERHQWVAAGSHARRAGDLAGGDEPAVRRLMEFLAAIGDRAGALDAFEALNARLAREYEAEPCAATRALADDVRELESSSVTAVKSLPEYAGDTVDAADVFAGPVVPAARVAPAAVPRRSWSRAHGELRSLLVTLVLMIGFISLWGLTRGDDELAPAATDAGVLVERALGPAALAEPLTGEVVRLLTGGSGVRVLLDGAPPGADGERPVFLLRTAVRQSGDSLQATVGLAERASGAAVASGRVSVARADAHALETLAARIARFARHGSSAEVARRSAELADVAAPARAAWERARRDVADADSLRRQGFPDAARVRLQVADSLLAGAEREARGWVQVPVDRAELELVRMWLGVSDGSGWGPARAALVRGIAHADRAMAIAPADASALELRGVLRTLLWVSTPMDSVRHVDALLAAAHADLERATRLSPRAARAWQHLSMILFSRGDYARAYHAADNALAADPFMDGGVGVRTQLFWAALEVGDTTAAQRGCAELAQQGTNVWLGSYCQLVLMAWRGEPVDDAPVQELVSAAPREPYAERNGGALAAVEAVLQARRGEEARARALLARVLERSAAQPELLHHAAWVHLSLGEREQARALLDRYVAGWPAARAGVRHSRRFAELGG